MRAQTRQVPEVMRTGKAWRGRAFRATESTGADGAACAVDGQARKPMGNARSSSRDDSGASVGGSKLVAQGLSTRDPPTRVS